MQALEIAGGGLQAVQDQRGDLVADAAGEQVFENFLNGALHRVRVFQRRQVAVTVLGAIAVVVVGFTKSKNSLAFSLLMESTLKDMAKTNSHLNWTAWRRFLEGEARPHRIWEIGFLADGKQYRFFCVFSGEKVVILLVGCYHKQKRYTPDDAISTAIKRAKALKNGTARTHARQIDTTL